MFLQYRTINIRDNELNLLLSFKIVITLYKCAKIGVEIIVDDFGFANNSPVIDSTILDIDFDLGI